MALAKDIGRTGPLQVEGDGRRAQYVGEAGIVMRHLDQDHVRHFDRLAGGVGEERSQLRSIAIGGVGGGVRVGHAMESRLVEREMVGYGRGRAGGGGGWGAQLYSEARRWS